MADTQNATAPEERELDRMARDIGIPPCPAILSRFSAEMHQPEPDTRKLAALIGTDIALSAALLKFVNSPFYGLHTKATNVHQALSIIGLRAGANIVTGLILRQAFPASSGPLMQRFWERCASLASAALPLVSQLRGLHLDEAHTYMLFRDCGIAVMICKFPNYSGCFDRMAREPGSAVTETEQTRYRYSHARVGYALARGWMLPESICKSILFHHEFDKVQARVRDVEKVNHKLIALGLLAEQVMTLRARGTLCPDWIHGERLVLDALNVTPEAIIALAAVAQAEAA